MNEILNQQKYSSIEESDVKCNHEHEAAIPVENKSKCCPNHSSHYIAEHEDQNVQKRTPSYGYPRRFNGYCFRCNNYGHKAINCRVRLPTKVSEGKYAFHIQFYNCHYFGHFARDCRMQGSLKVWKRKEQASYADTESVPNVRQSNVQI